MPSDTSGCDDGSLRAQLAYLGQCYKEGRFCDVSLRLGDGVVRCHRAVLAGVFHGLKPILLSLDDQDIDLSFPEHPASEIRLLINTIYSALTLVPEDPLKLDKSLAAAFGMFMKETKIKPKPKRKKRKNTEVNVECIMPKRRRKFKFQTLSDIEVLDQRLFNDKSRLSKDLLNQIDIQIEAPLFSLEDKELDTFYDTASFLMIVGLNKSLEAKPLIWTGNQEGFEETVCLMKSLYSLSDEDLFNHSAIEDEEEIDSELIENIQKKPMSDLKPAIFSSSKSTSKISINYNLNPGDIDILAVVGWSSEQTSFWKQEFLCIPLLGDRSLLRALLKVRQEETLSRIKPVSYTKPTLQKCSECHKEMEGYRLKQHMLTHDFTCQECGITFKNPFQAGQHRQLEHSDGQFAKCDGCPRVFLKKNLEEHKLTCDKRKGEELLCPSCGAVSRNKLQLNSHISNVHKACTCDTCHEEFIGRTALRVHIRNQHGTFLCDSCPKVFNDKYKLRYHKIRVHGEEGDNPLNCDSCGKGFPNEGTRRRHVDTVHMGVRPYPCRYGCNFSFTDDSNRRSHEKRKHGAHGGCSVQEPDTGAWVNISSFTCTDCPKTFNESKKLEHHRIRCHTSDQDKPFKCNQCGKGFLYIKPLKRHVEAVHVKSQSFICRFGCGTAFNDDGNRRGHEKRVHGAMPTPRGQRAAAAVAKEETVRTTDEPYVNRLLDPELT